MVLTKEDLDSLTERFREILSFMDTQEVDTVEFQIEWKDTGIKSKIYEVKITRVF